MTPCEMEEEEEVWDLPWGALVFSLSKKWIHVRSDIDGVISNCGTQIDDRAAFSNTDVYARARTEDDVISAHH